MQVGRSYSNIVNTTGYSSRMSTGNSANGWANGLGQFPVDNWNLVRYIYSSSRNYYYSFYDYLTGYYYYTPTETLQYFCNMPHDAANKVMDELAKFGNGSRPNFNNLNEDEKKLYLVFLGSLLDSMHVGNDKRPPYIPYAEMSVRLMDFIQEIRTQGYSDIKIGDCSQIHAFLTHQAAEMGFAAHSIGVMRSSPHLITFIQGQDKNIVFLDYSTLYPTGTADLQKALLVYERKYLPDVDGYKVYNSNEELVGIVKTRTNEQMNETINHKKASDYFLEGQEKFNGLNVFVGDHKQQVRYDQEGSFYNFGLGSTRYQGSYEDVYKELYGGYAQGALKLNLNLYEEGKYRIASATELMAKGSAFHLDMQNDNTLDYYGGLSYLKQQVIFSRNEISLSLGFLSTYIFYKLESDTKNLLGETISAETNCRGFDEDAYNLRFGYKLPDSAHTEVYANFIVQDCGAYRNAQDSDFGFFWDDKILEFGAQTNLFDSTFSLSLSYDNQTLLDTYLAKFSFGRSNYQIKMNYSYQRPKCDFLAAKNAYGLTFYHQLPGYNNQTVSLGIQKDMYDARPSIIAGYNLTF